jgi:hypothetical protein
MVKERNVTLDPVGAVFLDGDLHVSQVLSPDEVV